GCEGAARGWRVFDPDRMAELFAELLEHDAPGDVVGVAGGKRNNHRDIARRIILSVGRRPADENAYQRGRKGILHSSTPWHCFVFWPTRVWHGGQRNVTRR